MKLLTMMLLSILAATALSQTVYKCPSPTPGAPPTIQQMPCSPTGGGETMTIEAPKPNSEGGLRDSEKEFSNALNEQWAKQAELDKAENERRAALAAENRKAAAAEDQARATWYMGNAIWLRGR